MTDTARLLALLEAATPGPWECEERTVYALQDSYMFTKNGREPLQVNRFTAHVQVGHHSTLGRTPEPECRANAELIAESVNALPGLLDQVDRLRAALGEAEQRATEAAKERDFFQAEWQTAVRQAHEVAAQRDKYRDQIAAMDAALARIEAVCAKSGGDPSWEWKLFEEIEKIAREARSIQLNAAIAEPDSPKQS